jgi:hypothetical protein
MNNIDLISYRKDLKWPIGHGYGPVAVGAPSQRDVHSLKSILIHTTNSSDGNTGYRSEAAFLRDSPNVSCHFVVSSHDATVVQILPPQWIAWHAGDCADSDYENARSLGIEIAWSALSGPLPWSAIDNVTSLVRSLLASYPWITKIDMHRAQAVPHGRKVDPSGWSDADFYAWRDIILRGPSAPPSPALQHYIISHPRGARLREKPTTQQSATLLLLSHGTPIAGTEMIDGTETVEGEPRWVKTTVQHKSGFIWRGLLEVAP